MEPNKFQPYLSNETQLLQFALSNLEQKNDKPVDISALRAALGRLGPWCFKSQLLLRNNEMPAKILPKPPKNNFNPLEASVFACCSYIEASQQKLESYRIFGATGAELKQCLSKNRVSNINKIRGKFNDTLKISEEEKLYLSYERADDIKKVLISLNKTASVLCNMCTPLTQSIMNTVIDSTEESSDFREILEENDGNTFQDLNFLLGAVRWIREKTEDSDDLDDGVIIDGVKVDAIDAPISRTPTGKTPKKPASERSRSLFSLMSTDSSFDQVSPYAPQGQSRLPKVNNNNNNAEETSNENAVTQEETNTNLFEAQLKEKTASLTELTAKQAELVEKLAKKINKVNGLNQQLEESQATVKTQAEEIESLKEKNKLVATLSDANDHLRRENSQLKATKLNYKFISFALTMSGIAAFLVYKKSDLLEYTTSFRQ